MNKPPYELAALKAAILQCNVNIAAFQKGIDKEEEKIEELKGYIKQHEEYLDWKRNNKQE